MNTHILNTRRPLAAPTKINLRVPRPTTTPRREGVPGQHGVCRTSVSSLTGG